VKLKGLITTSQLRPRMDVAISLLRSLAEDPDTNSSYPPAFAQFAMQVNIAIVACVLPAAREKKRRMDKLGSTCKYLLRLLSTCQP
jgi:hypothetical protein